MTSPSPCECTECRSNSDPTSSPLDSATRAARGWRSQLTDVTPLHGGLHPSPIIYDSAGNEHQRHIRDEVLHPRPRLRLQNPSDEELFPHPEPALTLLGQGHGPGFDSMPVLNAPPRRSLSNNAVTIAQNQATSSVGHSDDLFPLQGRAYESQPHGVQRYIPRQPQQEHTQQLSVPRPHQYAPLAPQNSYQEYRSRSASAQNQARELTSSQSYCTAQEEAKQQASTVQQQAQIRSLSSQPAAQNFAHNLVDHQTRPRQHPQSFLPRHSYQPLQQALPQTKPRQAFQDHPHPYGAIPLAPAPPPQRPRRLPPMGMFSTTSSGGCVRSSASASQNTAHSQDSTEPDQKRKSGDKRKQRSSDNLGDDPTAKVKAEDEIARTRRVKAERADKAMKAQEVVKAAKAQPIERGIKAQPVARRRSGRIMAQVESQVQARGLAWDEQIQPKRDGADKVVEGERRISQTENYEP